MSPDSADPAGRAASAVGAGPAAAPARGGAGSPDATYVIVGAGLAGAKAAEILREQGFSGRVVLIGEEEERPYERPPLSKSYLLGESETEGIYVHESGWYATHKVELRTGARAVGLDRSGHEVELADGERLHYDKLLLATGASPRALRVPGADLAGVHYLRTVGESERLRDAFRNAGRQGSAETSGAGRVAICGGGWIGLETAAAARSYGADVVVFEPEATPLHRVLGPELGEVFAGLHRAHGVDVRTGTGVAEFRGTGGRVQQVVTGAGEVVDADTVVVAVGVGPNTTLAESAGLTVDDGVVVDSALRTNDPDIYAAGDVANAYNPLLGQHVRIEHWANALNTGPAAARSMLGGDVTYDRVPYFFTDQYDLGMEYSGHVQPRGYDEVVYRGDVDALEFIAFWLTGGRVVAGMNVNVWDVTDEIQRLVRAGGPVDTARLADPSVALDSLL